MTAFHTIAIPHNDILQGRLTMDVFAADLWEVYKGRGADEYRNPGLFFRCRAGGILSHRHQVGAKQRAIYPSTTPGSFTGSFALCWMVSWPGASAFSRRWRRSQRRGSCGDET